MSAHGSCVVATLAAAWPSLRLPGACRMHLPFVCSTQVTSLSSTRAYGSCAAVPVMPAHLPGGGNLPKAVAATIGSADGTWRCWRRGVLCRFLCAFRRLCRRWPSPQRHELLRWSSSLRPPPAVQRTAPCLLVRCHLHHCGLLVNCAVRYCDVCKM